MPDVPDPSAPAFLWLDMEMTGLDPEECVILEVAAVVTDAHLRRLDTLEAVVYQPEAVLAGMDEWNVRTHTKSGLLARVPSGRPLADVEADMCRLVSRYFGDEPAVLAGNSIGQDRKFVDRYMPRLAARLHYRMLDVSSFKVMIGARWGLKYDKAQRHRAVEDIGESIDELAYYLGFFAVPSSEPKPNKAQ
jgi:oligoribonuclease